MDAFEQVCNRHFYLNCSVIFSCMFEKAIVCKPASSGYTDYRGPNNKSYSCTLPYSLHATMPSCRLRSTPVRCCTTRVDHAPPPTQH